MAKYTGKPLQVDDTPEILARVAKIAVDEGISRAQVVRDILKTGLAGRERKSQKILAQKAQGPGR